SNDPENDFEETRTVYGQPQTIKRDWRSQYPWTILSSEDIHRNVTTYNFTDGRLSEIDRPDPDGGTHPLDTTYSYASNSNYLSHVSQAGGLVFDQWDYSPVPTTAAGEVLLQTSYADGESNRAITYHHDAIYGDIDYSEDGDGNRTYFIYTDSD